MPDNMTFSPDSRATSDADAHVRTPFIIGIAGGTASGKTTLCRRITEQLGGQRVVLLSLDDFYRDLTPEENANVANVNFDDPDAFSFPAVAKCLDDLRGAEGTTVPVYDFTENRRSPTESRYVQPADVVIIEGIMVLHSAEIRDRCNMKIFVDTADDLRLARRIKRDTVERGRSFESVIDQYTRFVKPSFDKYVLPSKATADIIIPWSEERPAAVDLITQHVRHKLAQNDLMRLYTNFEVIPSTMQTRGLHTIIRDCTTSREDFVFYADRLCRIAIEHALAAMPFFEKAVRTPTSALYVGLQWKVKLCGVSVIRSGEAMETALRACCAGIPIGKILVCTGSKELKYKKFPHDIAQRHVLLMDPVMSSGGTVMQAIDALLAEGVAEGHIVLISLIASAQSVRRVCKKYTKLRIITSEVDCGVDENRLVTPGVGDFGDRYFGTVSADDASSRVAQSPTVNHASTATRPEPFSG
mmetsp:Transcript_122338/g.351490  ORF Transcript_122338/g.351490 Transcript_122338/m.351490 type:complete len:471 (-) Transcript_122338:29-1441(-)